jgi:hypothetical protein
VVSALREDFSSPAHAAGQLVAADWYEAKNFFKQEGGVQLQKAFATFVLFLYS